MEFYLKRKFHKIKAVSAQSSRWSSSEIKVRKDFPETWLWNELIYEDKCVYLYFDYPLKLHGVEICTKFDLLLREKQFTLG